MVLSQAYLEWEQQTEQRGEQRGRQEGLQREQALILRQLTRRIGEVTTELRSEVQALTLTQVESLGEALLDFTSAEDLSMWLQQNA